MIAFNDDNLTIGLKEILKDYKDKIHSFSFLPSIKPIIINKGVLASQNKKILKKLYGKKLDEFEICFFPTLELMSNLGFKKEFHKLYCSFIRCEWLAQLDLSKKPRYRDHILHPAKVMVLGYWFLHKFNPPFIKNIIEILKKDNSLTAYLKKCSVKFKNDTDWENFVDYIWYITSLFHDICYPIEFLAEIVDKIKNYYKLDKNFYKAYFDDDFYKNLLNKLKDTYFINKISEDKIKNIKDIKQSHSCIGTIYLLSLISKKEIHSGFSAAIQLATKAILCHHAEDNCNFNEDPLTFLLSLADSLQEWGRDFVYVPGYKKTKMTIEKLVECLEMEIKDNGDKFDIVYKINKPEILKLTKWDEEKFKEGKEDLKKRLCNFPKEIGKILCM